MDNSSRKEPQHDQDPSHPHQPDPDQPDVAAGRGGSPVVVGSSPSLGDKYGYDALQDFAAENHLTPRGALTLLANAQAADPSSVPQSWSWVPPATPPRHGIQDLTAPFDF